ncbi:helix-turn-helix domain-containing protein [Lysinibacter cavernae]|uniref:AraC-like DNA-binding protein n=1 Tax=Lysinibacter cavernae TaxID=1640652 RepID=A0A7X5TSU6_9MICO|nr:AraC family transcriptional regulator [Lysinibacter cavernae]NIH53901.1 AraC-like DNA-binding protein [Lysinibacter cavernae]
MRSTDVIAVSQDCVTLVYIIAGAMSVDSYGEQTEYSAGDALLFTGRQRHSILTSDHAFILVSTLRFTEAAAHLLELLPDILNVRNLAADEPAVAALASQLGPTLGHGGNDQYDQLGSSIVCRMMANTVLVSIIRAWVLRGCAPSNWPSRTNDPFFDRVVEAIHADPGAEWSLERLAQVSAMSRSAFAARFRAATGTSPASYVTGVRIRSAQELLASGLGISDVSRAIGYESDDGFSRAFRRYVGKTPSAWRLDAKKRASASAIL